MYEAFYGFQEKPFNLTPDPRFLYLSEKHKEAFAHLLFGIKDRVGFILVSGEVGTGKTTICRTLINQLDEHTEVAFIFNPWMSNIELLRKINEDFGIASRADSVKGLVDELNEYLLAQHARGNNCVLIIDEAQDLEPPVLEQIRLLSNLETDRQKLLQIALVGQPELMMKLGLPELRQLNQRITARYHLESLDEEETAQYIAHRIQVSGGRRKVHFTRQALHAVYRCSKGTPRVINAVCDRALLIGYTMEVHEISPEIIKRAAQEVTGARTKRGMKLPWRRYVPSPAVVAAAALIILAGKYLVEPLARQPVGVPIPISAMPAETASARRGDGKAATTDRSAKDEGDGIGGPASSIGEESFATRIDSLNPQESRCAAAASILGAWRMAVLCEYPRDDAPESLAVFARAHGMVYLAFQPTLDQLLAINLPAFVKVAGHKQSAWVGLVGADDDHVRIVTGIQEKALVIRRTDFEECYEGAAMLLWQDPTPHVGVLQPSMSGEEVRLLQDQLHAAGLSDLPKTGVYDERTAAAVAQLQAQRGLAVDGRAGPHTRMVLASRLPGFAGPRLLSRPLPESPVTAMKAPAPPALSGAVQEDNTSPEDVLDTESRIVASVPKAVEDRRSRPVFSRAAPAVSVKPGLRDNVTEPSPARATWIEEVAGPPAGSTMPPRNLSMKQEVGASPVDIPPLNPTVPEPNNGDVAAAAASSPTALEDAVARVSTDTAPIADSFKPSVTRPAPTGFPLVPRERGGNTR